MTKEEIEKLRAKADEYIQSLEIQSVSWAYSNSYFAGLQWGVDLILGWLNPENDK